MKNLLRIVCVLAFVGCSQQELEKVQNASSVRDQLCAELDTVAMLAPEADLSKPREACKRGDDLKAIAAAYAGCYEPASSGGASSQPEPPAQVPPPVAEPAPTPEPIPPPAPVGS